MLDAVRRYYTGKLRRARRDAAGVDWNGEASQQLRFTQLLRVVTAPRARPRLLDYGCGYGALADIEPLG